MSNRCAQLSAGVVVGESLLSMRFEHPALVWLEEDAPEVIGCEFDGTKFERVERDENGDEVGRVIVHTLEVAE